MLWKLVDETQMSKPPKTTRHHRSKEMLHCRKEIGDFQIICSKVGGFRPFNYLLGVTCYLLSLKCKWLVLNKLCNFTAYKLFVSTNKQLSDPMDSMADPLFSFYSVDRSTARDFTVCIISIRTYLEVISSINARNVENPPFKTAGPISIRVVSTLLFLSAPSVVMK